MARINKTIQAYQQQLEQKGIKNIPDFVQSILDADITKGKYSRFLLDCYIQDKFREEDLKGGLESTVGIAVSLFHKHKTKLPEDMRSIYKYETPGDLWNVIKQFDGELSGKEIKKDLQEKIYSETEFVYTDEETGLKIISPLTEEASKWWGKGTRWCTSADKNNMFYEYADKAPLLILLMPNGDKLQLWKYSYDIQFMDEADNKVTLEYIEQHWTILEPICRWVKDLRLIPEKYMNYDICIDFLQQEYGNNFYHVPEEFRDYNLYLEAVRNNGLIFKRVPEYYKDYNLCLEAVRQFGCVLQYVPERYKEQLKSCVVKKEIIHNNTNSIKSNKYFFDELRLYFPEKLLTSKL